MWLGSCLGAFNTSRAGTPGSGRGSGLARPETEEGGEPEGHPAGFRWLRTRETLPRGQAGRYPGPRLAQIVEHVILMGQKGYNPQRKMN